MAALSWIGRGCKAAHGDCDGRPTCTQLPSSPGQLAVSARTGGACISGLPKMHREDWRRVCGRAEMQGGSILMLQLCHPPASLARSSLDRHLLCTVTSPQGGLLRVCCLPGV